MDGKTMLIASLAGILIVGAHTAGKGLLAGAKKAKHSVKIVAVKVVKHQK